jgi:putative ABC transport system permease protein
VNTHLVGWFGLLASIVFVGAALEKGIVVAVVRSIGQLLLVGLALVAVVDDDAPLAWSWLWVVAIVVFAGFTVARRAPAIPGLLPIALAAQAILAAITLAVVFGFDLFELTGRSLVPVAGMTLGNAMNASVVAASRLADATADQRAEIEARLALGLPGDEAMRPFLRAVLRTAMSPQIESTAALGIVFLPGTMTGLILAGVEPMDAVRTQLALMYVILAGVAISSMLVVLGASRRVVTADDRLLVIPRKRY